MRGMRRYPLGEALAPGEALRRLCRRERPFLLDGAVDADGLGRMSYGGCDPVLRHRDLVLEPPPREPFHLRQAPPLARLEAMVRSCAPLPVVGLLGYDVGRSVERLRDRGQPDDVGLPPIDLAAYDALYVHDGQTQGSFLLAESADAAARLRRTLSRPAPPLPAGAPALAPSFTIDDGPYRAMVRRVQEHLHAGDCYQVNLCRRLWAPLGAAAALPLYLRLRRMAPAPLGAYLQLDPLPREREAPILLSNSPELLLQADLGSGAVQTRPIKGTRPRSADAAADVLMARQLLASEKDLAEHLMIVDLLRNDLGRVCRVGSVSVSGYARLLELPTVHHLVSTVHGELQAERGWHDLLRAVVPGGSITGAPKVRAMEIIDELEPVRRGPFYGSICLMTAGGGTLSLCIRTAVVRRGELLLSVGGGVVVDSTPEGEVEETVVKAAAFLRALG